MIQGLYNAVGDAFGAILASLEFVLQLPGRLIFRCVGLFCLSFSLIGYGMFAVLSQRIQIQPGPGSWWDFLLTAIQISIAILSATLLSLLLAEPILYFSGTLDEISLNCFAKWIGHRPSPSTSRCKRMGRSAASALVLLGFLFLVVACGMLALSAVLAPLFVPLGALFSIWAVAWYFLGYPFSWEDFSAFEQIGWFFQNILTITLAFLPLTLSWFLIIFTPFSVPFSVILATRLRTLFQNTRRS